MGMNSVTLWVIIRLFILREASSSERVLKGMRRVLRDCRNKFTIRLMWALVCSILILMGG